VFRGLQHQDREQQLENEKQKPQKREGRLQVDVALFDTFTIRSMFRDRRCGVEPWKREDNSQFVPIGWLFTRTPTGYIILRGRLLTFVRFVRRQFYVVDTNCNWVRDR